MNRHRIHCIVSFLWIRSIFGLFLLSFALIKTADPSQAASRSRLGSAAAPSTQRVLRFDFGPGRVEPGFIQVLPSTIYTKELGYGFDPGSTVSAVDRGGDDALRSGFCTSDKPFFFSLDLPEGNYGVTVTLGDRAGESTTTIKAELRRLMLENVHTAPGKFETRVFMVNIRIPRITAGGEVSLKDREKTTEFAAWDDKLTFDPAYPDPVESFSVPASPMSTMRTPDGNTVGDPPRPAVSTGVPKGPFESNWESIKRNYKVPQR